MKTIVIAVVLSGTLATAGIAQSRQTDSLASFQLLPSLGPDGLIPEHGRDRLPGNATGNRAPVTTAWPANGHVRSANSRFLGALRNAVARSTTFRELVEALNRSDVIVYVVASNRRSGLSGYLVHQIVAAGDHRYLTVVVNPELLRDRLVVAIAHELQHAREVAETPTVRSAAAMRVLFQRLDSHQCVLVRNCTETDAALRIQAVVLEELKAAR